MDALEEALSRFGPPSIFTPDQGAQFTAEAFTQPPRDPGHATSLAGKGRCTDTLFGEGPWPPLQ